ncbi:Myb/SANT-like domain-containing protein [Tanacetum coccineum]
MEESMEANCQLKKSKSRVGWKNISLVKTFIEACIHAIALDGREGVSLKVLSQKKVAKAIKDNHNFEVDQKQMRNHFDYMKIMYGAWLSLKNRTGNIYDDSTNTFNLTEEEWELEIMKNKNV